MRQHDEANDEPAGRTGSSSSITSFDREHFKVEGFPHSKETTVKVSGGLGVQTVVVQTFRTPELGDTVFLQSIGAQPDLCYRLVITPRVAAAIARQREALTTKNRSASAKQVAQARKAAGIEPGFMKGRKAKG
jgi:hypothetical protein